MDLTMKSISGCPQNTTNISVCINTYYTRAEFLQWMPKDKKLKT